MGHVARNARLLALGAVFFLSAASPGYATTQACTSGPLIQHWDGAGWTQVASPGSDYLAAVGAVTPTDVWAIGIPESGPSALHWNGVGWEPAAMPKPKHWNPITTNNVVSVVDANDVWALAGSAVERWNGNRWQIVPTPKGVDLAGLAAVSATNVWAVGSRTVWRLRHPANVPPCCAYPITHTSVLHWNGSVWKTVPSPNPSSANPRGMRRRDELFAVAASPGHGVWAVGDYYRHGRGHHSWQTLVLHWNGKKWAVVPSANPGGPGHPDHLYGVAVAGRNDVWAVGGYGTGRNIQRPLVEHWNGKRWSVVAAPTGYAYSADQRLDSVSVVAPNDIWASGRFLDDIGTDIVYEGLAEHWDGSAWSISPTLHNWNEGDAVGGIAAAAQDDVWAVGGWGACS